MQVRREVRFLIVTLCLCVRKNIGINSCISIFLSLTSMEEKTNTPLLRKVILASSAGTLIEWYDFYIFGSLSVIISERFFPKTNPTADYLATLAIFATGFIVRPFGAIIFGRIGDKVGRKFTFLLTLILMGLSTFAIGLVPGY